MEALIVISSLPSRPSDPREALCRSLSRPICPRSCDGLAATAITGRSAAVVASRAAPATATTAAPLIGVGAASAGADRHRKPLHHRSVLMASRVHAIIGGEIQTDHVSSHSRVFASQAVGFVEGVRLVFAVIDPHGACVAGCCLI